MSELQGEIDPQTIRNLQDASARYGLQSGMPGSNAIPGTLVNYQNLLGNVQTSQALEQQGLQNLQGLLGQVGSQQLNPALLSQLSQANAQLLAAPDPAQAAQLQMQLYQNALSNARGPAGGTGYQSIISPSGGTGVPFVPGFGAGGVQNPTTPGTFGGATSYNPSFIGPPDYFGPPAPDAGTVAPYGPPEYAGPPSPDLGGDTTDLSSQDWQSIFANPSDYYPLGG
jgi:hypothetical protein